MSKISDAFAAGIAEVRKSWVWFLLIGILLMVLGATCIVKAQTATTRAGRAHTGFPQQRRGLHARFHVRAHG